MVFALKDLFEIFYLKKLFIFIDNGKVEIVDIKINI